MSCQELRPLESAVGNKNAGETALSEGRRGRSATPEVQDAEKTAS
jgi:hypothetical protein